MRFVKLRRAAVCAQALVRGHIARIAWNLRKLRCATLQAQALARGHLARTRLRRLRAAATRVQAVVRGHMARLRVMREIAEAVAALAAAQEAAQALENRQHSSATHVQSYWRRCKGETEAAEQDQQEVVRDLSATLPPQRMPSYLANGVEIRTMQDTDSLSATLPPTRPVAHAYLASPGRVPSEGGTGSYRSHTPTTIGSSPSPCKGRSLSADRRTYPSVSTTRKIVGATTLFANYRKDMARLLAQHRSLRMPVLSSQGNDRRVPQSAAGLAETIHASTPLLTPRGSLRNAGAVQWETRVPSVAVVTAVPQIISRAPAEKVSVWTPQSPTRTVAASIAYPVTQSFAPPAIRQAPTRQYVRSTTRYRMVQSTAHVVATAPAVTVLPTHVAPALPRSTTPLVRVGPSVTVAPGVVPRTRHRTNS